MNDWAHFEEKYGPAIGQGAQCRVYGDGASAVKVLSEGHQLLDVLREAYGLAFTESIGVPTSNLEGIYKEAGHIVIRMRRVSGRDLADAVIACAEAGDMASVRRHMEKLVDMQLAMHAAKAPALASSLTNFRDHTRSVPSLSEAQRAKQLAYLDTLPEGDAFCHNDYHPRNVLYDGKDYTVIDWDAAGRGDPAGDVAHSYLATMLTSKELADMYLELYLAKSGMDPARITRWLPPHALLLYTVLEGDLQEVLRPFLGELA